MYELMVIAKSDLAGEVSGKVEKFLKEINAASVKLEKLGKKTLAYPIAKQSEAEFFLYNFEAEGKDLKALSDKIRLEQEAVLRHLLIKVAKATKVSKHRRLEVQDESALITKEEVKVKPKVTVTTKSGLGKERKATTSKSEKKTVKSTKKGKKSLVIRYGK